MFALTANWFAILFIPALLIIALVISLIIEYYDDRN